MLVLLRRVTIVAFCGLLLIVAVQLSLTRDDRLAEELAKLRPTRQVTVYDVLQANIPSPTLTRVRFPGWSYYGSENLEADITSYRQAPMLEDMDAMPSQWRAFYPKTLPPVAERLPENPGVVRGCDSIGRYGGVWRRCFNSDWDIYRKIGYESFIRFDPSGRIQPALAWKWEVSDSNRVFTFYLRKGHRWSDGHPFTTDDLLWTLRDMVAWPYGSGRPDWMQETDGRTRLYDFDVTDWDAFLDKLIAECENRELSAGRLIADVCGEEIIEQARRCYGQGPDVEDHRLDLIAKLNRAFREADFCNLELFSRVDLQPEIDRLKAIGQSRLTSDQFIRLNNLREVLDIYAIAARDFEEVQPIAMTKLNLGMFRGLYADCVGPGRLRFMQAEAVPDEDGDDSHIIRFTFQQPNSIFLEKTGTFMFYLSLFDRARHKTAPLHVAGSNILNTIDILDWPGFIAMLKEASAEGSTSQLARLWRRLSPSARERVAQWDESSTDEAWRQALVDAINEALTSRDFFSDESWAGFDLDAELTELEQQGWFAICQRRPVMRYVNALAIRADLLKRYRRFGPDDLSADEIFDMNLMLLRTAAQPVMALDRERALDNAAKNHPLKFTSWGQRFQTLYRYDSEYNNDLPTLKPWRIVTDSTEQQLLAVRNPYYYKVDPEGNQLPYIDAIETFVESRVENLLLKLASGNVDFQVRTIAFEHYSYLKQMETQGNYELRLWANDYCGEVTFAPLQPHKDPVYAALQDNADFRHALSLGINRQEIIDVVFNGVGEPAQYSVPLGSPYYNEIQARMSVEYDPARANRLLDAMGLDQRNAEGIRLLSDGRPLIMNVETEAERPLPVVQMVCQYWRELGIDTRMQVRNYATLNRMMQLGILDIRVHKEGGNFFGPLMAGGYAPTHEAEAVQWFNWAAYIRTGGRQGATPPERIMKIQRMWEKVLHAPNDEVKFKAWKDLAEQTARDLPVIGIMTSPGKLVYVRNNFKNVPKLALAGWIAHDPGNCCPETFYFDDSLGGDLGQDKYR